MNCLGTRLKVFPKVFNKYKKDKTCLYSRYPVLETEIGPECPSFLRLQEVVLLSNLFYNFSHTPCRKEDLKKPKQTKPNFS